MTALSVMATTWVTALPASAYWSSDTLMSACQALTPFSGSAATTDSAMKAGVVPFSGMTTGTAAAASRSVTAGGRGPVVLTNGPRWLFGSPGSRSTGTVQISLPVSTSTAFIAVGRPGSRCGRAR